MKNFLLSFFKALTKFAVYDISICEHDGLDDRTPKENSIVKAAEILL